VDDATHERISQLLRCDLAGARERRLGAGGATRRGPKVWLLEPAAGPSVVVKQHVEQRGFVQERAALDAWADARMPRLLAADAALRVLVLERLPGVAVDALDDEQARLAAWQAAGEFLADLHARAIDDEDPLALAEALPVRLHAWARACDSLLDPATHELVARLAAAAGPSLAGARRVACHRDFTPSNWLWDAGARGHAPRLHVVDFEHSRPDLAQVDLAKLATHWRPELATAFLRGYGRTHDELRESLRLALALHGLASMAWGRRHGEAAFVDEGRLALARARAMV
jgi:Ser/Thr protein kinase RdoA (MazF antagonist)